MSIYSTAWSCEDAEEGTALYIQRNPYGPPVIGAGDATGQHVEVHLPCGTQEVAYLLDAIADVTGHRLKLHSLTAIDRDVDLRVGQKWTDPRRSSGDAAKHQTITAIGSEFVLCRSGADGTGPEGALGVEYFKRTYVKREQS